MEQRGKGGADERSQKNRCAGIQRVMNTFRILYIDDDEANRELVGFILDRKRAWTMLEADSGRMGLEKARVDQPDVIILDISLPDLNGYEVLEQLQADEATSSIPVIAMSGKSSAPDIEAGMKKGFAAYLTKPVQIDPLYAAIEKLLD